MYDPRLKHRSMKKYAYKLGVGGCHEKAPHAQAGLPSGAESRRKGCDGQCYASPWLGHDAQPRGQTPAWMSP